MKKYFGKLAVVLTVSVGLLSCALALIALPVWQSIAIGAILALFTALIVPSHYHRREHLFDAVIKDPGPLLVNEPVVAVTSKKRYVGKLCAREECITVYLLRRRRVITLSFPRESTELLMKDGYLLLQATDRDMALYLTAPLPLPDIMTVYERLVR